MRWWKNHKLRKQNNK
jgi:hypothetical protein